MSTKAQRGSARHYRSRRRAPFAVLHGRGRPDSLTRRITPVAHIPLMCMLCNGRAADRISLPKG
ncbi:hypothetical protein [Trinickia dinghuensis]|uniref:Uncharacterized protein n=1 Tax=Trinickia dinghuensis TaxID=2291023 RepID=A0A3D8K5J3_9BURK|nr:hypothetical protein [Trinickia dinghuensis]RDV00303.1 hypothetical protein DWV00_00380 [Trinickia dinghuensis]